MSEQTFKFFSLFFFFFFIILPLFAHLKKIAVTHKLVLQSSCTLVRCQKAVISINFGENPFKILIDHLRKTKVIFRHAYRVNR